MSDSLIQELQSIVECACNESGSAVKAAEPVLTPFYKAKLEAFIGRKPAYKAKLEAMLKAGTAPLAEEGNVELAYVTADEPDDWQFKTFASGAEAQAFVAELEAEYGEDGFAVLFKNAAAATESTGGAAKS